MGWVILTILSIAVLSWIILFKISEEEKYSILIGASKLRVLISLITLIICAGASFFIGVKVGDINHVSYVEFFALGFSLISGAKGWYDKYYQRLCY